ncbi:MAG: SMP-30/gluconolactonase/LRE family protein [Halioglobus sp.]|nr:SMP-30/gluconolactonase/LRE family protein [Halioglobus sp.]
MAVECIWDAGADLGEGVFWHARERAVYWVDIIRSELHRICANGRRDSWHHPGRPSAVMPCADGGLIATFENGIRHIDCATGVATPLLPLEEDVPHNRFNDGHSDLYGNFWFGSMDDRQAQKSGRFYCLNNKGQIAPLPAFGKFCITNGPAFSTDGKWVYFTDTLEKKIFRAALDARGTPGDPALYIDFSNQPGHPDGMCADTEGGLWVCQFGGHQVTRFDSDGSVASIVEIPAPNITKCAFGGDNLDTLYITTAATGLDEDTRAAYPLSGGLFSVTTSYRGMAPVAVPRPPSR